MEKKISHYARHKIPWIVMFATLLVSVLPSPSLAIPAFARKYDLSCTSCHTKPPRLNGFGEAFHMAGFQIPVVQEAEIKEKRRIGRVMSETNFLNIFSIRTTGDLVQFFSGGGKNESAIMLPQSVELYLAGNLTDAIAYFFELEHESRTIEGTEAGGFEETSRLGLGKEFFFMFDLSTFRKMDHGSGQSGPMIMGPMVMAGKIDPSTNFSYPTNRQLILKVPGSVDQDSGTVERFGLTPYAFASKFFGLMTADGKSVEVTRPVLYNTTGDLGIDVHAMVGPAIIQAGVMQGLNSVPADENQKKDPYLMGRVNFGGAGYLSGSLSGLFYWGNDTARVPIAVGSPEMALIDWLRYGVAGNIKYRVLDLYGAFIWDKLKTLPEGLKSEFNKDASGFTIEGDYLATDRVLLSLRYDQLNSGGLVSEKVDGKVLTGQARYYLRDNFSFSLRDSYNMEDVSDNPLQNFRNFIAFGLDFDF